MQCENSRPFCLPVNHFHMLCPVYILFISFIRSVYAISIRSFSRSCLCSRARALDNVSCFSTFLRMETFTPNTIKGAPVFVNTFCKHRCICVGVKFSFSLSFSLYSYCYWYMHSDFLYFYLCSFLLFTSFYKWIFQMMKSRKAAKLCYNVINCAIVSSSSMMIIHMCHCVECWC